MGYEDFVDCDVCSERLTFSNLANLKVAV
jgi:hypothetical protein